MGFIGRTRELAELSSLLSRVGAPTRADPGVAVAVRGRRRIGKSRLVTEFVDRSGLPNVYFQAARHAPVSEELALLADAVATSSLPGAEVAAGTRPSTLTSALTLLAASLPDDTPAIVVIDEIPWLLEQFAGGAGELQRVWDRTLAAKPVLMILVGSDLTMMESLGAPDAPFHGRATPLLVEALTPADVTTMTGLDPFAGFDAYLITGGQPLVVSEWTPGTSRDEFLLDSFARSTSALVVSGTRVLDTEFPESTIARQVLTAIGGRGERTFTGIQNSTGSPMNARSLSTSLTALSSKRVVVADVPLSMKDPPKDRRWRVADPALRFWLRFVAPALTDVDRGRPDLALTRVNAGYDAWRGRAIEPVVRAGLERLLPNPTWPTVTRVGGWWPRTNNPEIDLVGGDGAPAASVSFVGTIRWRDRRPLSAADVGRVADQAVVIPGVGADTPLVAVCPAGADRAAKRALSGLWTATDLLRAWP